MSENKSKQSTITIKQIITYAILAIFTIFCLLNLAPVKVNFLFAQINAPLVVIILLSYGVGVLVTWLLSLVKQKSQSE